MSISTARLLASLRRAEQALAPLQPHYEGVLSIKHSISRLTVYTLVETPVVVPRVVEAPEQQVASGETVLDARLREAEGAKTLLLEIIRRSAQDWVLYRTSRRLDQKQLAEEAYTWLFLEDEDHPHWRMRKAEGRELTAFIAICDALDMDPDRVRGYIRKLTPDKVRSSGRRPSKSAEKPQEEQHQTELTLVRIDLDYDNLILSLLPAPKR